jgi:hypothetical protein
VSRNVREVPVVRSACWSCGQVMEKKVSSRTRVPRFYLWHCPRCDVNWSGEGKAA